jgi:3',5'-cyclic AMP phosphodiesterase CpdA
VLRLARPLDPRAVSGTNSSIVFTLAHLSDTHLGEVGIPRPDLLVSKRILGLLTWHMRRKAVHLASVLEGLIDDIHAERPDHIVVTGDLVNISLPREFLRAAAWLTKLGSPHDVSVIPGNHDAYVNIAWERSLGLWADYMAGEGGDGREHPARGPDDFPYLRRRGPLAIIGVSSAAPMPPHMAAGRIGAQQMERLTGLLARTRQAGCCRVVLIHHPPLPGPASDRKQLLDSAEFRMVIAAQGAELILHGHTHVSGLAQLPSPAGSVPVVGVPSASARATGHKDYARYHLYRIDKEIAGWRILVDVRGVGADARRFAKEPGFTLHVAA